jgi:2-polyprenyl-6-hydroxyphenyl methylase/3-demethylubiquinone-9 3-methyltransferase
MNVPAASDARREIDAGERFEFGANWTRFLRRLDDDRIRAAEASLRDMLGVHTLAGCRFLDAGSGSGLFSLAARRLGATVVSFDFDPKSVACTTELRARYFPGDKNWRVEPGSVLDREYLATLGTFDVVYSWGVLHHTGAMWDALDNVTRLVAPGGRLFIAIYNDQGFKSTYWRHVKRLYVAHSALRWPLLLAHMPYPFLPSLAVQLLRRQSRGVRGMSFWYDVIDWIGGYPFEVATPDAIRRFYEARGFSEKKSTRTKRWGCNEFVLERNPAT